MKLPFLREACVENIPEALAAERLGADRLEYCADLSQDGLTPVFEDVTLLLGQINIPVMVMIRPRGGDFEYKDREIQVMIDSILQFRELPIQGIVLGITKGEYLNYPLIHKLSELAGDKEVCIHKAIDVVSDPVNAIKELKSLNITRVLTSGGAPSAKEGIPVLKQMIEQSEDYLSVMPAGKIKGGNVLELHEALGAKEYHGRGILMKY